MTDLPDLIGDDDANVLPLPDGPGDGQTGDDWTALSNTDLPPLGEGDGGPEQEPARPDPCTAEGVGDAT